MLLEHDPDDRFVVAAITGFSEWGFSPGTSFTVLDRHECFRECFSYPSPHGRGGNMQKQSTEYRRTLALEKAAYLNAREVVA